MRKRKFFRISISNICHLENKFKNYLICRSNCVILYTQITTTDAVHGKRREAAAMISSDGIRGYNDMIILCLVLSEPSYGYQISKEIKLRTNGSYVIKETTLYSAFTRLEKNGYITSFSGSRTNGKPRTYYRITESGKAYYEEKCREWELTKEVVEKFKI